ncbi:phage antirepressor KilAC domain-containing protein [Arsenophonus sp.]|uniref:phage antirepressor KilAC domain-containing protein n=2 Tax=Arsenophonus sp. TaxID=1872640 RepID=UPI00285A0AFE|nr:phage antirepressor KilAC domain-containing protein [Arsenophonus sp.]MDR5616857.1 phage antirepressor KilAC domain-containing protein [Arsenophonus sp.]
MMLNKSKTPTAGTVRVSNELTIYSEINNMNTLAVTTQNVTMSSSEIAELTGKKKADVHVDIWNMLFQLYSISKDDGFFYHVKNQLVTIKEGIYVTFDVRGYVSEFSIDRYHSEVLVTGYDVKRRAAVIKPWFCLETSQVNPIVDPMVALNDPAVMRGLLLNYSEKILERDHQIEEMKPDVAALERIAKSDGAMCVTDAAKQLQIRPKALFDFLSGNKWIYRRLGSPWIGYQDKIQQGLIEHKVTTITRTDGINETKTQVRITSKGIAKLAKLLSVEVAA